MVDYRDGMGNSKTAYVHSLEQKIADLEWKNGEQLKTINLLHMDIESLNKKLKEVKKNAS